MNTFEHYVSIGDTRLYVAERGAGYPVIVLHGGPGLDHHEFADYLDPLTDHYRLILVDERSQGKSDQAPESTWTLKEMAHDVTRLAEALNLTRYAVLGHSYGSFITLQHAVDFPGHAAQSIISSGVPAAHYLNKVQANLAAFEPIALREQVTASWAREKDVQTQADVDALMHDQNPFHFGNPLDPRIADYERRSGGATYSPAVLRHFSSQSYGMIDVEGQLATVPQVTLVLAGRLDRTCSVEASQAIAAGIPNAELVIFERSGHMTFVEETEAYLNAVRSFLDRTRQ